jgi:hypothetical protein
VQAPKITDAEREALASVKLPVDAGKSGYVQLLISVRAIPPSLASSCRKFALSYNRLWMPISATEVLHVR